MGEGQVACSGGESLFVSAGRESRSQLQRLLDALKRFEEDVRAVPTAVARSGKMLAQATRFAVIPNAAFLRAGITPSMRHQPLVQLLARCHA
jgi:hypothetical protein